ncbi:MAG: hypothetical protein MUF72_18630 [Elainella sp. Prado103]|nr:hypothetical protein [Elainella sp. Prado103]
MISDLFYLIRSKADGQYLVARPKTSTNPDQPDPGFLLIFREYADALSYLNAHASHLSDRFGVESLPGSQLKSLMDRWGFRGVGMVEDPLVPQVEFMLKDRSIGSF